MKLPLIHKQHTSKERTVLYATGADFCKIFQEDMKDLYLLSLVLAADAEKAEQCFVSGLDECHAGNQVFQEWARSWARRVVIKNAIRMITPQPRESGVLRTRTGDPAPLELPAEMSAVAALPAVERFAFVLSVLEGYSDQDSALLLGCTRESLIAARVRALQRLGSAVGANRSRQTDASSVLESGRDRRNTVEEMALPATLATPA